MMPNYPPAPDNEPTPNSTTDDSGTVSLAFGCAAAFFAFVPFIGVVAWLLGICGLVFGVSAYRKLGRGEPDNRVAAGFGVGLSSFALLVCVGWVVATLVSLSS
ncbi:hypothetical protein GIY23_03605 [Allosaccharopolyspora coralli]|uniref:DUF4190 domain-containing protein n=1 Tax=Allosaccharopolyspora coralli TaxID=2665642 RepID=A0A5Q3QBA6_9PSEU|nr:hypothetical protein [Allosaccharopolyspora coralli]QGK68755.1 hypothetical protein GIY23_03605 [Allosaccharopolyspora coralli]